MKRLKTEFGTYHVWGWSSKVRFDNTQERKLDQRTVQLSISLDMPKGPNNVDFSPQIIRFVESRNTKFLENDLIIRSDII